MELPLDKISDFLLIFDGSHLTKNFDQLPEGLSLFHLEDESLVGVELSASAYSIKDNVGYRLTFNRIYTLGNKTAWEKKVELKGCGPIAAPHVTKRSRKFYAKEDDE